MEAQDPANPKSLWSQMKRRLDDAQQERVRHEQQWKDNHKLVLGIHDEVFGMAERSDNTPRPYTVINRVRQIVDAHVAIMTEETPRLGFGPSELGEPADWLLKPESSVKLQLLAEHGVPIPPLDELQSQGMDFIDEATAQALLEATIPQVHEFEEDVEVQPAEGESATARPTTEPRIRRVEQQVPVFSEDDFYIVNAQLCADLLEQEVEHEGATMAHWETRVTELIFGAQETGHKDMIAKWDAQRNHFIVQNLYPFNVWIDPWANDTTDAEYIIVREFLPITEAKGIYPQHADYIEQHKTTAGSSSVMSSNSIGGKFQRSGQREVIERWTWWQRNQPFPLTEDEALEQQLVVPAMQDVQQDATDPETGEPLLDVETGEPLTEMAEQPIQTDNGEQVYRLVSHEDDEPEITDTLTTLGDEHWPVRMGLRQVQFLHDQTVFDEESPFIDIPIARAKCMFIEDSPYGQGEPQRVADLVHFRNRLFTTAQVYFNRFRAGEVAMPESVYQGSQESLKSLFADAQKIWRVPDMDWMNYGGQLIQNIDPPQLQLVLTHMMDVVDREIDKITGMSEVIRGETKSDQSGELFRQALEAARGPIGLKARNVQRALKHLGHVIAHLIIDFLPAEVWAERNRKYPVQVYERVKQRLAAHDVNVLPDVPGAETKEDKLNRVMSLMNVTGPLPTLIEQAAEIMGVKDTQKIVDEWQDMMMAQQQAQGQPA